MLYLRSVGLKLLGLALVLAAGAWPTSAAAGAPTPSIKLALVEGLSGPFANTGEAVYRNLLWGVERINAAGGVKRVGAPAQALQLMRYDSKGQNEEALSALRSAIDDGARFILQGNSSANAAALLDAINKHNERVPTQRVLLLNYSAVDPALTNEKCSFWHFRFDAHADMRLAALLDVIKIDTSLQRVYLIGQDYSFGQAVVRQARLQLAQQRPDITITGEELHPLGRVKDFLPYAAKIKASGAQAVITGNWGNDLTLLVKAAREAGFEGKFYTFYGNALGAPAALSEAGVGKVLAVAEWLPNVGTPESDAFYRAFKARFPAPADDYVHMRMQWMLQALAQSIERTRAVRGRPDDIDIVAVARQLEQVRLTWRGHSAYMRAEDHQLQQPLVVGLMERQGSAGVKYDVEGSGYGFRVVRTLAAADAIKSTNCTMQRP